MKNCTIRILSVLIVVLSLSSFVMKTKTYTYIDGNNNDYVITKDSINYIPITPEKSSSGIYSGGESKKIKITKEQFAKIEGMMKAIQKDKKSHADKREMGYGTIVIGKKAIYLSTSNK